MVADRQLRVNIRRLSIKVILGNDIADYLNRALVELYRLINYRFEHQKMLLPNLRKVVI